MRPWALMILLAACDARRNPPAPPAPLKPAPANQIVIGIEYCMPGTARTFAELGIPAAKHYAEHLEWSKMQARAGAPIDFKPADRFVREYQDAGFSELMLCLKSKSPWASKNPAKNHSPKPEHREAYADWIRKMVERYDHDGVDDMPGLRAPIRYVEIGSEFSTYEPEPVEEYLEMLAIAYRAAHEASPKVKILHAAFLTSIAFRNHPGPAEYESAFAAVDERVMHHSLASMRKIFDRPDLFDAVDLHSLADPDEIVDQVAWVKWEMSRRNYSKPIVIGDTSCSPFIAWGPADTTTGTLGLVVPPATEQDRPRLAKFFQKLLNEDRETVEWTRRFAADDLVKKVVIAAEQGVELINTAFVEDLIWLKIKLLHAGAGTSPWSGMLDVRINPFNEERTVLGKYPPFFALQKLAKEISGYTAIRRIAATDARIRLFEITRPQGILWIGWIEPGRVILPGEPVPSAAYGNVVLTPTPAYVIR